MVLVRLKVIRGLGLSAKRARKKLVTYLENHHFTLLRSMGDQLRYYLQRILGKSLSWVDHLRNGMTCIKPGWKEHLLEKLNRLQLADSQPRIWESDKKLYRDFRKAPRGYSLQGHMELSKFMGSCVAKGHKRNDRDLFGLYKRVRIILLVIYEFRHQEMRCLEVDSQ